MGDPEPPSPEPLEPAEPLELLPNPPELLVLPELPEPLALPELLDPPVPLELVEPPPEPPELAETPDPDPPPLAPEDPPELAELVIDPLDPEPPDGGPGFAPPEVDVPHPRRRAYKPVVIPAFFMRSLRCPAPGVGHLEEWSARLRMGADVDLDHPWMRSRRWPRRAAEICGRPSKPDAGRRAGRER